MEEPASAPRDSSSSPRGGGGGGGRADVVLVGPVVGVQTPANRFGRPGVEREIRARIFEMHQNPLIAADNDDFEDTDSEDESVLAGGNADGGVGGGGGGANGALEDGSDDGASVAGSTTSASAPPHEMLQFGRQRMNLTVLSQQYNLYFVAYKGRIHVYEPQNAPQVIKDGPLLVLKPAPSAIAALCPGHIDQASGHEINNIIVGDLGDLEVIVAAYDDGDVVGYYTHTIAAAIEHLARKNKEWTSTPRHPRAFFHDAVGSSAWGLALHKKSRLLAVSCNLMEITVFAFALKGPGGSSGDLAAPTAQFSNHDVARTEGSSPLLASSGLTAEALERHLRGRTRDWRIILTQPSKVAANVPGIDFLDDEHGSAEKVVVVDINGSCWMHSIWSLGASISRIPMWSTDGCCNWGVMVLPDKFFRQAQTAEEFLGAPVSSIDATWSVPSGVLLDISRTAKLIPGNPTAEVEVERLPIARHRFRLPPTTLLDLDGIFRQAVPNEADLGLQGYPESDEALRRWESDETLRRWELLRRAEKDERRPRTARAAFCAVSGAGPREPMTIVPSIGHVCRHKNMAPVKFLHEILYNNSFRKNVYDKAFDFKFRPLPPEMACRNAVLRATGEDVELFCLDPSRASIICRRLLPPHNPDKVKEPWDMDYSNRVCMKHCIPELNLVVVGSTCGRVALLRLTKARRGWRQIRHGFRVEWVLPRTREEQRKARPHVWMVGMAVSRVPQPGARGVNLFPPGRGERRRHNQPLVADPVYRWRLMLHFMDHTILTYTIEDSDPNGQCSVKPYAP
ncbi:hypothetical protein RB598_008450 [Gaeumannomyces tritici]